MRIRNVLFAAIGGGLLLGMAGAATTPTQMRNFAHEPWRNTLQARDETVEREQPEEAFESRLAANYDFLGPRNDLDDDETVMGAHRDPERGRLTVSADTPPLEPGPRFEPLGLAEISTTRPQSLPATKPRASVSRQVKSEAPSTDLVAGIY